MLLLSPSCRWRATCNWDPFVQFALETSTTTTIKDTVSAKAAFATVDKKVPRAFMVYSTACLPRWQTRKALGDSAEQRKSIVPIGVEPRCFLPGA